MCIRDSHSMVYNGRDGSVTASQEERPFPVELLTGQELDGTRLEVELTLPGRIKQELTQVRVGLPVSVDDRDAHVVQGRTAAGRWPLSSSCLLYTSPSPRDS